MPLARCADRRRPDGRDAGLRARRQQDRRHASAPPPMTPVEAFRSGAHSLKSAARRSRPSLARIRRRERPRARAVEARPHVCRRRRRRPERSQGLRVFPPHRRTAMPTTIPTRRRRALSPTPLSRSAIIISRAFRRRTSSPTRSRARHVRLCGVLFPRSRRAILSGAALSRRQRRAAGSAQAARWFGLSAQKGQCQAQAMLGAMLFAGDHVPRQAARGLMWLTLAKDSARADRPGSPSSTTAP